ncbi:hypothetical protein LXL04_029083 [Taraxacum kok-saghyz]
MASCAVVATACDENLMQQRRKREAPEFRQSRHQKIVWFRRDREIRRSQHLKKAVTVNTNSWTNAGHAANQIYDLLYMMGRDDIDVGVGGEGGISRNGKILPNVGGYLPIIDQGSGTGGPCRYRQVIPIGSSGGRLDIDTNFGFRKSFLPQKLVQTITIIGFENANHRKFFQRQRTDSYLLLPVNFSVSLITIDNKVFCVSKFEIKPEFRIEDLGLSHFLICVSHAYKDELQISEFSNTIIESIQVNIVIPKSYI